MNMKKTKKGISLIVLIITIIVIVILATAILVSIINNNPISEANKAKYESDRDNMQAVFTNIVASIMVKELGTVNVTAGQINTETSGAKETTGEVEYTVENAMVASNASGKIVFDKGTNTATTYYTGKKLPIYAAGETKWYVDSEGMLSLEVAGAKYGSSEVYVSLGNYEHKFLDGTVEEHDTIYGICSKCSENVLAPGVYDINDDLVLSWEESRIDNTCSNTSVIFNYVNFDNGPFKIIIPGGTTAIADNAFCGMYIKEVIMPNSIQSIGAYAFQNTAIDYSIVIPNKVETIGAYAFEGLAIESIPNSVREIGESAFQNCQNTTMIIPSSVEIIGKHAFQGSKIQSLYLEHLTPPSLGDGCFHAMGVRTEYQEDKNAWVTYYGPVTMYFRNKIVSDSVLNGKHYNWFNASDSKVTKSTNYNW